MRTNWQLYVLSFPVLYEKAHTLVRTQQEIGRLTRRIHQAKSFRVPLRIPQTGTDLDHLIDELAWSKTLLDILRLMH